MTQLSSSDVPGMGRRQFMNLLTFGSVTGVALGALYPVVNYFIPLVPLEAEEEPVLRMNWGIPLRRVAGCRAIPRVIKPGAGTKGDPTYLIVEGEDAIGSYGINAICTHLGCVVPEQRRQQIHVPLPWEPSTTLPARSSVALHLSWLWRT